MASELNIGIFGKSLCGKTTLAKALAKSQRKKGYKTIVFDPNIEPWKDSLFFNDEKLFWQAVWMNQKAFIVIDEGSETIDRNKDLIPIFTRIRHMGSKLCVLGHDGNSLLPVMRRQLSTVFFFKQTLTSLKIWEDCFKAEHLKLAENLNRYEFIRLDDFQTGEPVPMKLKV